MSGVAPSSPVSAANTNQAFIDANGDDSTIGRLGLANTLPESGSAIVNTQKELNSIASYTGKTLNDVKTALPAWTNNDVGSSSDNLKQRSDSITEKFNSSLGHKHTGASGDAPQISSFDLSSVKLRGYFIQAPTLTSITGSSVNVSSQMGGSIPSTGDTVKGVVVTNIINYCFLKDVNGTPFEDGSGNEVYGRLTESSGVWTLSFYVLIAGVETAYSFSTSSTIQWYYQQLFNPITDAPVYSELAVVPSSNATQDVIDATESISGKVMLGNSAPPDVSGSSSQKGTSTSVAHSDHTHLGVRSIFKTGDSNIFGDIEIAQGPNLTITRSGNKFTFDTFGAVCYQEVPAGPCNGSNTTFGPLSQLPSSIESVLVFVDGLPVDKSKWTLTGYSIIFSGGNEPLAGQDIYVFYASAGVPAIPPAPSGTLRTEFRTITSTEALNKKVILAYSPAVVGDVLVDIIGGGGAQEFNVDYTVVSNEFRWNGYALDGVLTTGDKIRFHYIT